MARRCSVPLVLAALTALILTVASSAGSLPELHRVSGDAYVAHQVLVRYEAGTTRAERRAATGAAGAASVEALSLPRTELLDLDAGVSVDEAIAALEANPDVAYAEPNYLYEISALPNDTNFAQLWGLNQVSDKDIDAPEAWDITTGSQSIIVAVIDSGVAYDHPDLAPNIWTNDDDTGDAVDDDLNGFVDDTHGWDFFQGDNVPLDANHHGTHVAGTIGARGNNALGVTGVNWQVTIMPLRAGDAGGSLPNTAIIGSIDYACKNGAKVVNGSFGGSGFSQLTLDMINSTQCANTLFVFAAGNGGSDQVGDNNDSIPQYPCNYNTDRIICVAATDQNDGKATFSNIGPNSVDLAAPGVGIFSSTPTFNDLLLDGFEDTPTLFNTRWGNQTVKTAGQPLWGQQNFVYAGGGTYSLSDSPAGNYPVDADAQITSLGFANLSGRRVCSLDYYMHLSTFAGDVLRIYAATSAVGPFVDVTQGGWSGSTGTQFFGLTEEMADFDGAATVYLRFRLTSNLDASVSDGAHIDDVAIKCVGTPPSGGEYETLNGTSMATPHVAGAAALVWSRKPTLTPAEVKAILLSTVDPVASMSGNTVTGGRLNLRAAVAAVDVTAPPVPSINSGPSGLVKSTTATFTFSNSEGGVTFECRVDAGAFAPCTSPAVFPGLAQGGHTFQVQAKDGGLNVSAAASRSWTIDSVAPNTSITSGPKKSTKAKSATFKFKSTEAGSTFKCKLDKGPWTLCKSAKTYKNLKKGSHTFQVAATDKAGNADKSPAKKTWKIA